MSSFNNSVVGSFDGDSLRCIPVSGGKSDRCDRIYLTASSEIDGNFSSWRFGEDNAVAAIGTTFSSICTRGNNGDAGTVVVQNQDIDFGDADIVVSQIGTASAGCDRAQVRSFDCGVVHGFDSGGLRQVPVSASEGERGDRFYLTVCGEANFNIIFGLAVERYLIGVGGAAFNDNGITPCLGNCHASSISGCIVVGDADGDWCDRHWQIFRRAACCDAVENCTAVGSFNHSVVRGCHRYCLRHIPVNRSENDRRDRIDLAARSKVDRNVSSWFSVERYFVIACGAAFSSSGVRRCDRDAGRTRTSDIIIGDDDCDRRDRDRLIFHSAAVSDAVVNRACVQPFDNSVVGGFHRDCLRYVPVGRGESKCGNRVDLNAGIEVDLNWRRRFAIERYFVIACGAAFSSSGFGRVNCDSGGIVVGNLGSDGGSSNQVVFRVCTGNFVGDRTGVRALSYSIVHGLHSHHLRHVPVSGSKFQSDRVSASSPHVGLGAWGGGDSNIGRRLAG